MKPPVLHINIENRYLCNLIEDGSNWPEKYMDDDVARFLEYCVDCENEYIKLNGSEKMVSLKNNMRRDKSKDDGLCNCGNHPDQGKYPLKDINTNTNNINPTLRMYLENY
jgi:hypothetical protein